MDILAERSCAKFRDQMTSLVELRGVSRIYGSYQAVEPTDLEIRPGEFVAILGPSGCGKTTLLRMIGGFVAPSTGIIKLAGQDVTRIGPEARPTNMVFQGYGLFPHMTVTQNVGYGLRLAGVAAAQRAVRVEEALQLVHLTDLGERKIDQLSGGQRQRVALARALIMRPKVLLLDEPLAALDLKLRRAMQEEFRRIHAVTGGTFMFVTHDQEEAMSLATRICVMERGRIVQDGTPRKIYLEPRTRFVSKFIGEANLFPGRRIKGKVRLDNGLCFACPGADGEVACVVRPENIIISSGAETAPDRRHDMTIAAKLIDITFLGPNVQYKLVTDNGEGVTAETRCDEGRLPPEAGTRVSLWWNSANQRVLTE
ncbi:MAG: ABC transporter ATP-binding protein [Parvibaculaceae bacterium]